MAKSKLISRIGALALAAALACTSLISASAATIDKATIDMDAKAQLSIYKYDFTNAKKDGVWDEDSYVSTGQYDAKVNEVLGGTTRTGANSASSALGNGQASNGYAIKGVEYTYLKIADITQFTESEKDGGRTDSHIEVLYAINKVKGADMLAAIGLADGKNSYENANALDANNWYYQSDVLSAALKAALEANSTTVKNSLEAYVKNNGGTAMPETNEDGYSNVTGLPVGLYLLVETRTPEMVTGTTNPCFVSLPMTTVDGGMADGSGNQITTGGQDWNYNVVLYPKNETGIVTLEKTVREAAKDTGINNAIRCYHRRLYTQRNGIRRRHRRISDHLHTADDHVCGHQYQRVYVPRCSGPRPLLCRRHEQRYTRILYRCKLHQQSYHVEAVRRQIQSYARRKQRRYAYDDDLHDR